MGVGSRITEFQKFILSAHAAGSTSTALFPATRIGKWVRFKGHPNNSGLVYIGLAGVTTANGWPLDANEQTDWLPISGSLDEYGYITENAPDSICYKILG